MRSWLLSIVELPGDVVRGQNGRGGRTARWHENGAAEDEVEGARDERVGVRAWDEPEVRAAVREAHGEWKRAQQLFDQVSDPDLVDVATHRLLAAEKQYMYLMKQLRNGAATALAEAAADAAEE